MRAAYVQMTPRFGAVSYNREALCARVASTEADLVVLPELCVTGYQFKDRKEATALAEPAEGATAMALWTVCRQHRRYAVVGIAEKDRGRLFNAALLVGPRGLLGTYRKTHLFWDEPDWAEPGDTGLQVWETEHCRLGVMICFDYAFPEAARTLALAGAEVIAQPSNLVLPLCQQVLPVRALENRVFTVMANRCGVEARAHKELRFTGGSQIAGPDGAVLARAPAEGDHAAVVQIDPALARDKRVTPRNDVLADRRPEHYRGLDETHRGWRG